ncbi:MAG TPA: type II toxin-antitoxin system PemK/MazF family toxin [Burkholderiales bacterium]|nr:type II toxin-antitoxin system PemK/MazF family toxin [Burkholderiales bacterium]
MTFEAYDVVVVPFPFTDRAATKRRPALVLSDRSAFNAAIGHVVLAMITSASHSDWPLDVALSDLQAAGLASASVVRMKLFTLDERLILRKAGSLAAADRKAVAAALRKLLKPLA